MFAALIGAAAVGSLGEMYFQHQSEQNEIGALQTESKEEDLSYTQKQIQNYTQMQQSLAHASAQASVTGFNPNSASFNAIGRNLYSQYGIAAQNLDAEKSLTMSNLQLEQQNVQNQFYGQMFGDVGQFAGSAAMMGRMMPTTGS